MRGEEKRKMTTREKDLVKLASFFLSLVQDVCFVDEEDEV